MYYDYRKRLIAQQGLLRGVPLKYKSGSDDMCVRTDEKRSFSFPAVFLPGSEARGKTVKNQGNGFTISLKA